MRHPSKRLSISRAWAALGLALFWAFQGCATAPPSTSELTEEPRVDIAAAPWRPGGKPWVCYLFNLPQGLYHAYELGAEEPFLWGELTGAASWTSEPRGVRHGLTLHVMTGAMVPDSLVSLELRRTGGRP